jgi:hypothetical protein
MGKSFFPAYQFYFLQRVGLVFRINQRNKRIPLGIIETLLFPLADFRLVVILERPVKTAEL